MIRNLKKLIQKSKSSGVTLLLTVLVLSAVFAAVMTITNIVIVERRASESAVTSVQAIYASETGVEWQLYSLRKASVSAPVLSNGATFDVSRSSGNTIISIGKDRNSLVSRAIQVENNAVGGTNFGTGNDQEIGLAGNPGGFVNINRVSTIAGRTDPDAVNFSMTKNLGAGSNTIDLDVSPQGLSAGDEILIIDLQGTPTDISSVGNWETAYIDKIRGQKITLKTNLLNTYPGNIDKIMVQRVPNYDNLSIASYYYWTADAWDGTKGGVFFIRVKNLLTLSGGSTEILISRQGFFSNYLQLPFGATIGMGGMDDYRQTDTFTGGSYNYISYNPKGYRGGGWNDQMGYQGESRTGPGVFGNTNNNDGGGGAYAGVLYGGAGGGGYKTNGGNGSSLWTGSPSSIGGIPYGADDLVKLYLGSGGGNTWSEASVPKGGFGGGIIYIAAKEITNGGIIKADATYPIPGGAFGLYQPRWGGPGGASGGSVFIATSKFYPPGRPAPDDVTGLVRGSGSAGLGGNVGTACLGYGGGCYTMNNGGNGSDGRMTAPGFR